MKRNLLKKEEDSDPISVVSNLFDVAMVFAVALMVALVTRYNMTEMLSQEDFLHGRCPFFFSRLFASFPALYLMGIQLRRH